MNLYKRYSLSDIFNTTKVSEEEYNKYLQEGFASKPYRDNNRVEIISYIILFIIFNIFALVSFALFYKLRKSYIIRQRNFVLTLLGGILAYLNVCFSFIPQITKVPCSLTVFSANVLNVWVNFTFLTRSLSVILNYHFNIFKVSSITKKKLRGGYNGSIEPNNYLPKIYKKIDKIIGAIIIIPTLLSVLLTIIIYYTIDEQRQKECPIWNFTDIGDAMIALKNNKGKEIFRVVMAYGAIFMIFSFINAILLSFVKDANKYGVKFECISVSILVVVINVINIILQVNSSSGSDIGIIIGSDNKKNGTSGNDTGTLNDSQQNIKNNYPRKMFLAIFEKTKGGKMLFSIVSVYMIFASITLPVIHYYKAKHLKNHYFQDPSNSIQYFYKVLNTPSLVNELRSIAIKEFSVENVLFWENYQILQKMVYRYQAEYKKAKEKGDERIVSQYDFESYYQRVQQSSFSDSSMDEYSYDPNMPVPKEIMSYYTSFYHMFIDFNGPAVVNLPSDVVKRIFNDICTYPTVGMYDTAKNEVVEMMFSSIYPILLRDNKKHLTNTLG